MGRASGPVALDRSVRVRAMDHIPSEELLSGSHSFPCVYQFKAIGSVSGDFQTRVVEAVVAEVESREAVGYSVRETPGGRHVALTLNVNVESPDQVRSIYARIRELDGLVFLL
jgi:putative lipoic acid-binding regulatory protein